MKVCMTYSYITPHIGGVEHHMELVARELVKQGCDVTFIVSERSGVNDEFPVTYCWTPFEILHVPVMPAFPLRAMREEYDIIHTHATMPFVSDSSLIAARLRGRASVVTYHFEGNASTVPGQILAGVYNRLLKRHILRLADRIVVTTESYAETCAALEGHEVEVIPNPVDVARYDSANTRRDALERYGLADKRYILFLGRIARYKSLEVLIESFILLHEIFPDLHLVLAGEIRDREYHRELITLARHYRVDERILFTGTVPTDDLPTIYGHCEVYVLPSMETGEAFGMTVVEAALSGARVVTADKPGVREVAALVGAHTFSMDRPVLNLTEELMATLRENAPDVEKVRQRFAPKAVADRLIDIYESLI